ncbi:MAG: hypothetical protein AAB320_06665 [Elusimicrobiota bacterium]
MGPAIGDLYVPPSAPQDLRRRLLALSFLGLAAFLAWQALALRSYIRADTRPPAWDQAIHLDIALDYRNLLKDGRWSDALHLAPKPGMPPFPPLYHLGLVAFYDQGAPPSTALWLNWFYLALLTVSVFAIAFHFRPDGSAAACALLISCSPAVQDMLHTQLIDLPLAALAAAAYWTLIESEDFTLWAGSVAFGLLFALGMLHKWSFFSYVFPAYFLAARAASVPASRFKVLAAVLTAVVLTLPWYWVHAPVMVPRLFQASADFAVPVWKGGAFFRYLGQMNEGLGPAFWLLACIGLLVPQYPRNAGRGWVLTAWFVTTYVFWAVVPNRQMRFLLPGLAPLAVAGLGAWPKELIWMLAALQLFTAGNFTHRWLSPITVPAPFYDLTFFPSQPPATEDWKIAEILEEAERRHDPTVAISNVTLVANDTFFNGPNFVWTAKRLALPHLRMRGVNRRLSEFSEFVVLKQGKLGPAGVIDQLPEAAAEITRKKGWFEKAYEEVRRWPLPDDSVAVLYQQRAMTVPPVVGRSFDYQFYSAGPFEATDLKLQFGDWDPQRSVYRWAKASAGVAKLRGITMSNLEVEMEDVLFVPVTSKEGAWEDVRFLRLGRLRVKSLEVSGGSLRAFLESRVPHLRVDVLELEKTLKIRGTYRNMGVSAEAEMALEPKALRIDLVAARLGPSVLPFLGRFRDYRLPLTPNPETPFFIEISGLTLRDGQLTVP